MAASAVCVAWLLRRSGLRNAAVAGGVLTALMLGPSVGGRTFPRAFEHWIDGGALQREALRDAQRLVAAREVIRATRGVGRPDDPAAVAERADAEARAQSWAHARHEFGKPRRLALLALAAMALLAALADPGDRAPRERGAFAKGAWLAVVPICMTLLALAFLEGERATPLAIAIAACTGAAAVATGVDRALVHREETTAALAQAARWATVVALIPLAFGALRLGAGLGPTTATALTVAGVAAFIGGTIHGRVARWLHRSLNTIVAPSIVALLLVDLDVFESAHWLTTAVVAITCSDGRWLGAWIGARLSGVLDCGSAVRTAIAAQGAVAAQLGFTGVLDGAALLPAWATILLVLGALYLDVTARLRFGAAASLRASESEARA